MNFNWLVYIGVWYFGMVAIKYVTELLKVLMVIKGVSIKVRPACTYLAWTMVWIWICWRFI